MKRNLALLFTLGVGLSTCGMTMLAPWVISEVVDGVGTSPRHILGYTLMIATALISIATAIQFARLRGWQFVDARPMVKFSSAAGGLCVATVLFVISYVVGRLAAQLIAQA